MDLLPSLPTTQLHFTKLTQGDYMSISINDIRYPFTTQLSEEVA